MGVDKPGGAGYRRGHQFDKRLRNKMLTIIAEHKDSRRALKEMKRALRKRGKPYRRIVS